VAPGTLFNLNGSWPPLRGILLLLQAGFIGGGLVYFVALSPLYTLLTRSFGQQDWATVTLFALLGALAPVALHELDNVGGSWPLLLYYGLGIPVGLAVGLLVYYGFNPFFDVLTRSYVFAVARSLRVAIIVLALYGGLLYLTYSTFQSTPTGFIPQQ